MRRQRSVRGKTGTLAKVDALSGYVMPADGRMPVAFSIIVTGISDHARVRQYTDRVVERLADLPAG
jgi:D-alanyl-D-alanine carboxypeptidase